ncbi:MAG: 50S ribosomal protein L18Ae [Candidatus Anstonellales archaeon]
MKVKGFFKKLKKRFEIEVDAKSKKEAMEKAYSYFGSKMGMKRGTVEITEVA